MAKLLNPEVLRSLGHESILETYVAIGTPSAYAARIVFVQNLTDVALLFSFDGTNNHFILPASGFLLLDITSNKSDESGLFLAADESLYVKQSGDPTTGSVYLSLFSGGSRQIT